MESVKEGNLKEKDIVNAVKKYFEEKGSLCIEEFWLPTKYPKQYKKPDLLIIPRWKTREFRLKWEKDLPIFDVIAIECKYKGETDTSVLSSLPQAIVYQQFFPKVCIACLENVSNQIRKFLIKNGVGYVTVSREKIVKEKLQPNEELNIFNPIVVKQNYRKIANKLVVLALGRWKFGSNIQRKGEHYGDFNVPSYPYGKGWIATYPCKNNKSIQWSITTGYISGASNFVYSGLNIEKPKRYYEKIFKRLETKDFLRLLRDLPEEYLYLYYKKDRRKGQIKPDTERKGKVTELVVDNIREIRNNMTSTYGGYFGIFKMVWKEGFTERESKKKLDEVDVELREIFEYLCRLSE